ncbi:hypothetical protein QUB47_26315, partial [Microcoleus sp. AT9_B5]
ERRRSSLSLSSPCLKPGASRSFFGEPYMQKESEGRRKKGIRRKKEELFVGSFQAIKTLLFTKFSGTLSLPSSFFLWMSYPTML